MPQNSAAAMPNKTAMRAPDVGAPAPPWPCALGAAVVDAGAAAGLAGAAVSLGGCGCLVLFPSLITVAPRITSSSMLTLRTPSLVLHSSSVRRCRLVAYSVLACLARRLGMSVLLLLVLPCLTMSWLVL